MFNSNLYISVNFPAQKKTLCSIEDCRQWVCSIYEC